MLEAIEKCRRMGLLKATAERDLEIYNLFQEEKAKVGTMQAYCNLGFIFFLSEASIRSIVKKIERNARTLDTKKQ